MSTCKDKAPAAFRRLFYLCAVMTAASCLSACALFQPPDLPPLLAPGQAEKLTLAVPFFAQTEHQCGPAATAMLLRHAGKPVTPESLSSSVYSQAKQGSLQPSIVAAIRRQGLIAYEVNDWSGLLAELNAGRPVLVLENLGVNAWPVWHYSVVIGYDSARDEIIQHSGVDAEVPTNARRFAFRWLRAGVWGVVALEPGAWPAIADENSYLNAVLGFERVNLSGALAAYQAAVEHWPASAKAWLGYGNAAYQQKDYKIAIMAFEKASTLTPELSGLWNNLALSYKAQGRTEDAKRAIQQALKLAPTHPAILDSAQQIGVEHP